MYCLTERIIRIFDLAQEKTPTPILPGVSYSIGINSSMVSLPTCRDEFSTSEQAALINSSAARTSLEDGVELELESIF